MTRRHLMTLRSLLILGDGLLAAAVFLLVSLVRFEAGAARWSVDLEPVPSALLFAALWVLSFWVLGLYRFETRWSLRAEVGDVIRGTAVVAAITLSLLFLLRQEDVSRLFLGALFVVQPAVALTGRAIVRRLFDARRERGKSVTQMLVVGGGALAQSFADRMEEHRALGIMVIGHLAVPGERPGDLSRPMLGSIDDIHEVFRVHVVDEVAICLDEAVIDYLEPAVSVAADEGKTVRVPRRRDESVLATAIQEEFDDFLVHSIVRDGHRDVQRAIKRAVDILGATFGIVLLSPLMVAAAVLVRLDGSPILFTQTRVGRNGRLFNLYKFRSMHPDAEERLAELADRNEVRGAAFKIRNDPRVTEVGRMLRRSSIDELPQLVNVLRGDMSLVGPRPALPREVASYDIWHRRRLSVRPGMTGLWQVEARMEPEFDERAELDLRYIDHWSLWMDLWILVRTVPAVLIRPGH